MLVCVGGGPAGGDRLTVTGSEVEIRQLVLAKTIEKDGVTVKIRNDEGRHL